MIDKHLQILSKVMTGKKMMNEEYAILLHEFDLILKKASENRIEFSFLNVLKKKYPDLFNIQGVKEVYEYGDTKIRSFSKSVSFFQKYLNGTDYVVIKTYYPFPAIVSDIDILFFYKRGYSNFVERLTKEGFYYIKDEELKGSLQKPGFMKCEPHNDISWHGMRFVSKDFIKKNLTKKRMGQSVLIVPNNQAAFVISAAHILFDCQYLSLRDYYVLKRFLEDKSIVQACINQADQFGWRLGAEYLIRVLSLEEELPFPFWIPITKVFVFFKDKLIFDFKKKRENHFAIESILLPLVYYYWKKVRSKFSRRVYRNSWLY